MDQKNKYFEFARAIVEFQRAVLVPLAQQKAPLLRWQGACAVLVSNEEMIRDQLARRLGLKVGATYGEGAASFLSILRSY
jgi:hypothetical protein